MSSNWLILCTFLSKICSIFYFLIFCKYCVAWVATFLSHLPSAAKGKWPSSPAFSPGELCLELEKRKNWNEQLSVTMHLESLEPCQMANYILSGPSVQPTYLPKRKETLFLRWVLHLSPKGLLGLFCSSDALVPSRFSYILCASKSIGSHRMKTVRQTR